MIHFSSAIYVSFPELICCIGAIQSYLLSSANQNWPHMEKYCQKYIQTVQNKTTATDFLSKTTRLRVIITTNITRQTVKHKKKISYLSEIPIT